MRRLHARFCRGAIVGALLCSVLAGCSADDSETVQIYAAASLKEPFEELAKQFESEHDGVTVQLNFAGSSELATHIQNGAPADVFASADEANMQRVVDDERIADAPAVFATNTLTISVPPGNPARITSLTDLTRNGVNLVVCAPQVPCGAASDRLEEAAGLSWTPKSEELSVTDVLNKVIAGEADAGLVYATDIRSAGDRVEQVAIDKKQTPNRYPIAAVAGNEHPDHAEAFIDLVLSDIGRAVLADAGFALP